nr:hypothetical protein [uncultured Carboxylicivirga sp.]
MKTIFSMILSMFLLSSCTDSELNNNDWFEMNLKNKPVYVKEISIFSLTGMDSEQYRELFNNKKLRESTIINEYSFDSLGWIINEYCQVFSDLDSIRKLTPKDMNRIPNGKDSIILDSDSFPMKMRHYFDNDFLIKEVYEYPTLKGETTYIRNLQKRIIEKRIDNIGVDSHIKIIEKYILNENNDIISSSEYKTFHHARDFNDTSLKTTKYQYLYDKHYNWILKLEFLNDTLNRITEREIKYKLTTGANNK